LEDRDKTQEQLLEELAYLRAENAYLKKRRALIQKQKEQEQAIKAGSPANLTILDEKSNWQVDRYALASKSHNSPFHGERLPITVRHTIYEGIFVVRDGTLTGERYE